jgi:MFS family permease
LALWALVSSSGIPVRQAYLNDMIASKQRATVLSFDSLMGSSGGVVVQPLLGRAADLYGYAASLAIGGVIELAAVPFLLASRRQRHQADQANAPTNATNTGSAPA